MCNLWIKQDWKIHNKIIRDKIVHNKMFTIVKQGMKYSLKECSTSYHVQKLHESFSVRLHSIKTSVTNWNPNLNQPLLSVDLSLQMWVVVFAERVTRSALCMQWGHHTWCIHQLPFLLYFQLPSAVKQLERTVKELRKEKQEMERAHLEEMNSLMSETEQHKQRYINTACHYWCQ